MCRKSRPLQSAVRQAVLPLLLVAIQGIGAPARAAGDDRAALQQPGDAVLMTLHAVGVQVYVCRRDAGGALQWTFQAPEADLFAGGERVGHHSAGPTWAYRDGSLVTGKVIAKAAGTTPADVPWLRLAVATHAGSGAFDPVDIVLRTETKGGMRQGPCAVADAVDKVPYEADYTFVRHP